MLNSYSSRLNKFAPFRFNTCFCSWKKL